MKNKIAFLLVALCCLSSCSDLCYQVYTVTGASPNFNQDKMTYEDSNCAITYDMWAAGGDAGFIVKNKTQQTLYFDLTKSYYILNGVVLDYFQNRTYSDISTSTLSQTHISAWAYSGVSGSFVSAASTSSSSSTVLSKSSSISYSELPILAIPAGTWRFVKGFQICDGLYHTCNFKLKSVNENSSALLLNEAESPIVFSNMLVYKVGENGNETLITNKFYVSAISNVSEMKERKYVLKKFCEDDSYSQGSYELVDESANHFYNIYNRYLVKY